MSRYTDPTHGIAFPVHAGTNPGPGLRGNTFSILVRDEDEHPVLTVYGDTPSQAGRLAAHVAHLMNSDALRDGQWNPLVGDPLSPREEARVVEFEMRRKTP